MSARSVIAAADEVQARIADAEKAITALTEIKRLHAARIMPSGVWLCDVCCFDSETLTEECMDCHDHAPGRPVCSTVEIIERAGL